MNDLGKYMYGIIPDASVLKGCLPSEVREGKSPAGRNIATVSYRDIAAVVSDAPCVELSRLGKEALAKLLVAHQQVLEYVMELGIPVVPLRLGTWAPHEADVKMMLSKGYNLIKGIQSKILSVAEIDVAVTWSDFIGVLKKIGEEQAIQKHKSKLLANSQVITVDDQMRIGLMMKKSLDEKRTRLAQIIEETLAPAAQDFKVHERMDDTMVSNVAFLVAREREGLFYSRVEVLNAQFAETLNFRCVGPLPPYSFYTLEIKKIRLEEVAWARNTLDLQQEEFTREDVKKAYRTKSWESHPDHHPDHPDSAREFDEVKKAYTALVEYCQGENGVFIKDEVLRNPYLVTPR